MNPNIPFRDRETALKVSQSIKEEVHADKTYKIMEVFPAFHYIPHTLY